MCYFLKAEPKTCLWLQTGFGNPSSIFFTGSGDSCRSAVKNAPESIFIYCKVVEYHFVSCFPPLTDLALAIYP